MPECDYCGAEFDDEETYLDHLGSEHDGELKRIDQRRVEEARSSSSSSSTGTLAIVAILVLAAVGGGAFVLSGGLGGDGPSGTTDGNGGGGVPAGFESDALPQNGNQSLLQEVQTFEYSNAQHLSRGSDLDFRTMPPTGGPHYSGTVDAGFYTESQSLGDLIHNLEHGNVVIYYEPGAISPDARASLQAFADAHRGTWSGVVVVPHPEENPDAPIVLTAWGKMLKIDGYDARTVRAFLAEYIGRGPENPVR